MARQLMSVWFKIVLMSIALFAIAACGEEETEDEKSIRSVRTITVVEPASGKVRRFSGTIEAATISRLSFEVSGNVNEVKVDTGQKVTKGQILATLDPQSLELEVEAAESNLRRADVELQDAQRELERLEEIADLVSRQSIDQAQTALATARKNRSYMATRVNMAIRDLDRAVLYAPFDGTITRRNVDQFQEINRGQILFDVHASEAMEAAIKVPESEIQEVRLGMPGMVRITAVAGATFPVVVTEIAQSAGEANSFPVRLTITENSDQIRPGLTAEVTLMLENEAEDFAYLIPINSLIAGSGEAPQYFVYLFDQATSTLKKTPIEHGGIRDDNIAVTSGIKAGDIVVIAGVSFLRDGQKVRLM